MTEGFVYFIRCEDRVKIGYSENPAKRLTKINADAPFPCDLIGYVRANDFPERDLHERFAEHRLHSEWFRVTDDLMQFVKTASVSVPMFGDRFDRRDLAGASGLMRWRYSMKLSQAEAGAMFGVTGPAWSRWESGQQIAVTRVLEVEAKTGVSRYELRPDIYGRDKHTFPDRSTQAGAGQ